MNRIPSADRIESGTGCGRATALQIRRLLDGRDSVSDVMGDEDPYLNHASQVMDAVNHLLGTHGVEAMTCESAWHRYWMDIVAVYANTGDAYAGTILFDVERGTYVVTSWGDWVETAERSGRYKFQ